ncbi:hypothetical protein [Cupriavidus basilensis]|uniref:hypothetical protein n=1 Tax=Cupriavidus basilensis TaxID=68895 RepID=UPI0039F6EF41
MPDQPFCTAALLAEFRRLRWSGVPEEMIRHQPTRLALLAAIEKRLAAERMARKATRHRILPADDYKRRQANDLD